MRILFCALWLALSPAIASAAPRVVADIAPVHSLVASVMEGVAEPALLLPPGASPHGYAMRPSDARTLSEAEIVFWVGETLTPWLEHPVDSLAGAAQVIELGGIDGLERLGFREGEGFSDKDHEGDGHDDHHGHGHHDHDEHGNTDPHFWLDPQNAVLWTAHIAEILAATDPQNADRYRSNARDAQAEIDALTDETTARLAPLAGIPFVVFHDGYHYFEARFGVEAVGAITLSDAATPGPRHLRTIRKKLSDSGARCVFAEPQQPEKLIRVLIETGNARMATLDPLGSTQPPGPALYPALIRGLADSLTGCLTAP